MTWRLLPAGERAVLVEVDDLDAVLDLDATVGMLVAGGESPWPDVVDRVPAARTLLVTVSERRELAAVAASLRDVLVALQVQATTSPDAAGRPRHHGTRPHEALEVVVHYDGPDLADVARLTGLDETAVVAAHTGRPWRVGFCGFAPGFAYLIGGDPRLVVPRRPEPRTAVPPGAVALAGAYSAVYPRGTPGGWQLLGHTDAAVWDPDRTPPALLQPGRWVRFVDGSR